MKIFLMYMLGAIALSSAVQAAPVNYDFDPDHTYPSFEADHFGISIWRGKFNKSAGKLVLDKAAGSATVDVTIDLSSVDFGHDKLNSWMIGPDFFDTANFPQATYKGKLSGFSDSSSSQLVGELTLHGVTKPLALKVGPIKCKEHPMLKRDYCGADAYGVFKRDDFGLDAGKAYGFNMDVTLRIQVEALKAE